jgi:hypothetical protein
MHAVDVYYRCIPLLHVWVNVTELSSWMHKMTIALSSCPKPCRDWPQAFIPAAAAMAQRSAA